MEQYHEGIEGRMDEAGAASSVTAGHSLCPAGGQLKGQHQHNSKQRGGRGQILSFLHNLDYVNCSWTSEDTHPGHSQRKEQETCKCNSRYKYLWLQLTIIYFITNLIVSYKQNNNP